MKPITDILQAGQWRGRSAFVVGSGPSLKGFDFGLLRNELTIGVNDEYLWGPTIALAQDPRIVAGDGIPGRTPLFQNPAWYNGPHIPVYFEGHPDRPKYEAPDTVYKIGSADGKQPFVWGKSLSEGLYYGANAGMAALNLADILGADPIYLLGFDARADAVETHHHSNYPKEWTLDRAEDREAVYGRWIKEFRVIAQYVRAEVLNFNPESGIDAFQKYELWPAADGAILAVPFTYARRL